MSQFSCSGSAQASIAADASIGVGIHLTGSWSLFSGLQSASLTGTASARASATAQVQAAGSCLVGPGQIAQIKGPGTTVWIGPIPVVITSQLLVDLKGSISSAAQLTTGVSGGYSATAGIGWTSAGGLYGIHSSGPSFSYNASDAQRQRGRHREHRSDDPGQHRWRGHADLNLSARLDLHADNTSDPWWTLTAPVSMTAGLNISRLGLSSPTMSVYSNAFMLAPAGGPFTAPSGGAGGAAPGTGTSGGGSTGGGAGSATGRRGTTGSGGGIYWRPGPDWNTAQATAGNRLYPGDRDLGELLSERHGQRAGLHRQHVGAGQPGQRPRHRPRLDQRALHQRRFGDQPVRPRRPPC